MILRHPLIFATGTFSVKLRSDSLGTVGYFWELIFPATGQK